jgi:hypothetical protein
MVKFRLSFYPLAEGRAAANVVRGRRVVGWGGQTHHFAEGVRSQFAFLQVGNSVALANELALLPGNYRI